jgi:hypothetical protein
MSHLPVYQPFRAQRSPAGFLEVTSSAPFVAVVNGRQVEASRNLGLVLSRQGTSLGPVVTVPTLVVKGLTVRRLSRDLTSQTSRPPSSTAMAVKVASVKPPNV